MSDVFVSYFGHDIDSVHPLLDQLSPRSWSLSMGEIKQIEGFCRQGWPKTGRMRETTNCTPWGIFSFPSPIITLIILAVELSQSKSWQRKYKWHSKKFITVIPTLLVKIRHWCGQRVSQFAPGQCRRSAGDWSDTRTKIHLWPQWLAFNSSCAQRKWTAGDARVCPTISSSAWIYSRTPTFCHGRSAAEIGRPSISSWIYERICGPSPTIQFLLLRLSPGVLLLILPPVERRSVWPS